MNVKQLFAGDGTSNTGTGMFERLRTVLGGERSTDTYAECRRCGRTVDHEARDCPHCGRDAIVRYELNRPAEPIRHRAPHDSGGTDE